MKSIAVLCGYTPSLIKFRKELLLEFNAAGLKITAFGPQNDGDTIKQLKENNIYFQSFKLQTTGLNPLKDVYVILHFIRQFKLDNILDII